MKEFNIKSYREKPLTEGQKTLIKNFINDLENGNDFEIPVGLQSYVLSILLKTLMNMDKDKLINEMRGFFNE